MVFGLSPLEVIQRALEFAAIIQQVCQVDARFTVIRVELQRLPQRRNASLVVAQTVLCVPDTCHRFGGLAGLLDRGLEKVE